MNIINGMISPETNCSKTTRPGGLPVELIDENGRGDDERVSDRPDVQQVRVAGDETSRPAVNCSFEEHVVVRVTALTERRGGLHQFPMHP